MDLEQIKAAGYQTTILTVITNSSDLDLDLNVKTGMTTAGQAVTVIEKK